MKASDILAMNDPEDLRNVVFEQGKLLNMIAQRLIEVGLISELGVDLGNMAGGGIIFGNGEDPFSEGNAFTGTVMTNTPLTDARANEYSIMGMNAGKIQFGIRATDGAAVFDGGDSRIDENGLSILKGGDTIRMYGAAETMLAAIGHSEFGFRILAAYGLGSDLVVNGDFATGDLSDWTAAGGVVAAYQPADKTGWAATLASSTSLVSTNYMTVSANTRYVLIAALKLGSVQPLYIRVDWYNSSNAKVGEDLLTRDSVEDTGWLRAVRYFTSPATAAKAKLYITHPITAPPPPADGSVTDISFRSATASGQLYISDAYNGTIITDEDFWALGKVYGNGGLGAQGEKVTDVAEPTALTDAATKNYVDGVAALLANYLPLAGGTMTGNIVLTNGNVRSKAAVTLADDEAINFTPGVALGGMVLLTSGGNDGAIVFYNATGTAVAPAALSVSANVALGTGALTTGTTNGTDTKLCINVNADGKIYVKNRRGASRIVYLLLI